MCSLGFTGTGKWKCSYPENSDLQGHLEHVWTRNKNMNVSRILHLGVYENFTINQIVFLLKPTYVQPPLTVGKNVRMLKKSESGWKIQVIRNGDEREKKNQELLILPKEGPLDTMLPLASKHSHLHEGNTCLHRCLCEVIKEICSISLLHKRPTFRG